MYENVMSIYLPPDNEITSNDLQIPNFENQKDKLVSTLKNVPPEVKEPHDEESKYGRYRRQDDSPLVKEINQFMKPWLSTMSYSFNVCNNGIDSEENSPHLGAITATKYSCDKSPLLRSYSLDNVTIPFVLLRDTCSVIENEERFLFVTEYEMHNVKIISSSISAGTGGRAVETISFNFQSLIDKYVLINIDTGDMKYSASKWDGAQNKAIRNYNYKTSKDQQHISNSDLKTNLINNSSNFGKNNSVSFSTSSYDTRIFKSPIKPSLYSRSLNSIQMFNSNRNTLNLIGKINNNNNNNRIVNLLSNKFNLLKKL